MSTKLTGFNSFAGNTQYCAAAPIFLISPLTLLKSTHCSDEKFICLSMSSKLFTKNVYQKRQLMKFYTNLKFLMHDHGFW